MNHLPTEIWGEIYASACVDDGCTGRSLSLVSRFVHETSKPYKLQSIAVTEQRQLNAFADLIERTPTHLRRVKCIFLSARVRNSTSRPSVYQQEVCSLLERILIAISPSVRIVHTCFMFHRQFVLLPVSLPALEELVVHGPINSLLTKSDSIQFIALKHLTIACHPTFHLKNMLRMAPSLLTLRIFASGSHPIGWLTTADSSFPTYLQRILIYRPAEPCSDPLPGELNNYNSVMRSLRVLDDADSRVALLPPNKLDLSKKSTIKEVEATWNVSAAGISRW